MNRSIILLLALLLATTNAWSQAAEPYAAQWKTADSLLHQGLPESARKIADKVYGDAQRTAQPIQMLKAQLYLMRIDATNNESADSLNIARAEAQGKKAAFPINAVWQSIAAQLYWNYYQQHRYEILQRTTMANGDTKHNAEKTADDFEQWDATKFVAKTSNLYLKSITNAEALKAVSIASYDAVLIKGSNTRNLRPTLFDLLAFRAIDFFENDEKDLTKPAFAFVMDDAAAFAPAKEFMRQHFKTQDTMSMQYRALTLYQEVLRLHEGDASPDAFIDADLQRLQFVYAHSVHPYKKALYLAALQNIEKAYANNPLSATASFRIAELMMQAGNTDEESDREGRGTLRMPALNYRAVKAKLDAIVTKFPASEGGAAARLLLLSITQPSLTLTAEEAVLPDAPSKILVTYKNVPKAYFRIVKMGPNDYRELRGYANEAYIKILLAAKPVQTFSSTLPSTEDYTQHRTEVKLDALPLGMYAVIISAKESFTNDDNAVSYAVFQVTRLAVVMQSGNGKGLPGGYILDRKQGTPVANASVAFFTEDRSGGHYEYRATTPVSTGSNGALPVLTSGGRVYNGMLVKKDSDAFYTAEYMNFYSYARNSMEAERTFFFTDRSIYRPGQTVFFKGIYVHTNADGRNSNVQTGKKVEVTFYDANSQKVASQSFTTNEWGSFTGTFTAPQGGLTGAMHIEGGNGSAYISVEEYKRPKFSVEWDTLKSDYALGETVQITGHAAAYAGNNVDGATVKYRVVRNVGWPYWWYSWRFGGGRSAEQQMAEGTATTDADGKFIIRFTALPDRSIDERSLPVFTYTVYADVTDLNGETRSGQKSISAGYRSLQIVADIPEQASRKDLDTVRITTQNLNGDFVAASVNIKVARLAQPDVIYRKRYWPVPDQFTMSEAEFRKSFPLDAYKDEDDYRKWKEAEIVYEERIKTTASGRVTLPVTAFHNNGWYCITLSAKDKNGKAVEEKKFVQIWDAKHEGKAYTIFDVTRKVQVKEPGDKAVVNLLVGMNSYSMIQQVQTMDGKIKSDALDVVATEGFPFTWDKEITEADRGGIALSYITVKDNRVYTASARIDVPWTNKDLSIEWETHRDKLQPGAAETWTMVVRGNKKDKVAAEMAAALYDASLDAFKPHGWGVGSLFPTLNVDLSWNTRIGFGQADGRQVSYFITSPTVYYNKVYDEIREMEVSHPRHMYMPGAVMAEAASGGNFDFDASSTVRRKVAGAMPAIPYNSSKEASASDAESITMEDPITGQITQVISRKDKDLDEGGKPQPDIPVRKNLQETAFFYPQLHTDADGAVRIQFSIPEALTEWKLLAFAHTKDMRTGFTTGSVKTQKDLMVQPGLPRFLRQGDELSISTKIVNLSDAALSGTATLEVIDALTGKPLNNAFSVGLKLQQNFIYESNFTALKGGSTSASWTVHVPKSRYEPVIIRISAKAGAFTDGEENTLPVLTNRMLVTETLPLWMNGAGTKTFSFDKLKASDSSKTLAQHRLTLEYTANPAWLAVKALPYLMEYPYECAEQTFNRYYANALAAHILEKAPKVKAIFKKWEEEAMLSSFKSPLEQNEELKSALLEETPWVLDAQSESEQRKNIALLFETSKLARDLDKAAKKLEDMMLPEGGWPWFKGDNRPDRYITQYIVTGIGRLQHLGVNGHGGTHIAFLQELAERSVPYLDRKMEEDYRNLLRNKADMKAQHISYFEAQYAYMRSFFSDIPAIGLSADAKAFYKKQAQQYWPTFNPYVKGMLAIALHRGGDKATSATIIQSLKETSIQKEELGMYWMERGRSWYWYEAPIEAQSLLIECFGEVAGDNESVDKMKRWLLKQKQTQNWGTTKATADACYALLLQGSQWLASEPQVTITLGDASAPLSDRKIIRSQDFPQQAGTGYFKVQYPGAEVKPEMGNITLTISKEPTSQPSWGAVYWQYFENLDKITSAATPLVVKKQLLIEKASDRGPVLEAIKDGASLKIGDKVKARIEIIVDRDMEYVDLKDGRASCFEPTNVLSGYRWQGGLGYYESTKDASSNFFFSYLPKGKYVFEYSMFVTNSGDFSTGLATIQCMYAPEFSAHSGGTRVQVK